MLQKPFPVSFSSGCFAAMFMNSFRLMIPSPSLSASATMRVTYEE